MAELSHGDLSRTPSITMRILSSVGKRRRVERLALRIKRGQFQRSGSLPSLQGTEFQLCFLPALFTLRPGSWAAGVDCRLQHPSQKRAGRGAAVAASLLPVAGELKLQMCSLTSGFKLSHFR